MLVGRYNKADSDMDLKYFLAESPELTTLLNQHKDL